MSDLTGIDPFVTSDWVSHIELAAVTFDQWVLTVAVRAYEKRVQGVGGMVHVIFDEVEGFRVLDEGKMLAYPWGALQPDEYFVHKVLGGGWLDQEMRAGNMVLPENAKEYVVVTSNECVSVIAYAPPVTPAAANKALNRWPNGAG